jgi:hypothetical protein
MNIKRLTTLLLAALLALTACLGLQGSKITRIKP